MGRKARVASEAEPVVHTPAAGPTKPRPAWVEGQGAALRTETYETARLRHPGYDIYFVESEWRA
ncbi:MAG: hypothetical protein AAGF94_16570 [Pseudomonadota bacterium]